MSVATQIQRIQSAKGTIKSAIEAKGVTVPSGATIDTYPTYISQIETGGSGGNYEQQFIDMIENKATKSVSVTIPDSVTSIGEYAFYVRYIKSVTIPDSVTSIGQYAFSKCIRLTTINIPDSVTSIGQSAFSGCSSLTSIEIPNSVTTVGGHVFQSCSGLTSVTIGSSLTSIGDYMFSGCTSLTTINIPDSVTSIGFSAFQGCTSLQSIEIPDSVTSIGISAFSNCTSLTSITVKATTPPTLGSSVFDGTNNCPIYVLSESVDSYKTATNWSSYADRIQAIPTE